MGFPDARSVALLCGVLSQGCYTTFSNSVDAGDVGSVRFDAPAPPTDRPGDRPTRDAPVTDRPVADAGAPRVVARAMVGARGGVLAGGGVSLGIPAGALPAMTELTVTVDASASTGRAMPLSPVLRFGPAGVRFAEPVLINVEIPAGVVGRLYWTREGDETTFEPVGYAENGRARAWIRHFSAGYVAGDGCQATTPVEQCACRGIDRGDALCVNSPPENCDAAAGWIGSAGGMCSGYGLRDEFTTQCGCTGPMGQSLCSTPHELPSQRCVDGTRTFTGANGGSCFGYFIAPDPNGNPGSRGTSGTLSGCAQVPRGTVWTLVQGRLADCNPRMNRYDDWTPPAGVSPMSPLQAPPMGEPFMCE
jgi:hypothetical protein